jgi:poly(hydroxyalkanoate) depolymerase family esterase
MANDSFLAQMREATQILRNSGPAAATKAIQRALKGLGRQPEGEVRAGTPQRSPDVIDLDPAAYHRTDIGEGRTVSGSVTNAAGTRAYRLYVPSGYRGQPLPLVVMLHGCSQTPDDFATGTTMNAVAEENDCLVAYPGQTQSANGSNCWNWFLDTDQRRDRGEPSIIADITKEIARGYSIDVARTYVAGLSAGGAMAAIMATTYPDVFAAAGIHSGLAYRCAGATTFRLRRARCPRGTRSLEPFIDGPMERLPLSTGSFTAPAMRGPAVIPKGPIRIRAVLQRLGKCCAFSWDRCVVGRRCKNTTPEIRHCCSYSSIL